MFINARIQESKKASPPFEVDGLLVVVRSLMIEYKMGYKPVGEKPYTTYDLFAEAKCLNHIGRAFLSNEGIEIRLNRTVRETLISIGHSVIHPENEAYECGYTEVDEFALVPTFIVGHYEYSSTDFGFTVLRGCLS